MFGFFPVFFSSSASFCLAAAAWSSCGITGSMFGAICTVWAASGSVLSSVCKRASSADAISRGMGAAVLWQPSWPLPALAEPCRSARRAPFRRPPP